MKPYFSFVQSTARCLDGKKFTLMGKSNKRKHILLLFTTQTSLISNESKIFKWDNCYPKSFVMSKQHDCNHNNNNLVIKVCGSKLFSILRLYCSCFSLLIQVRNLCAQENKINNFDKRAHDLYGLSEITKATIKQIYTDLLFRKFTAAAIFTFNKRMIHGLLYRNVIFFLLYLPQINMINAHTLWLMKFTRKHTKTFGLNGLLFLPRNEYSSFRTK